MITKGDSVLIDRIEFVKQSDILTIYCSHRGCVEALETVGDYCINHDPNPNCKATQTDIDQADLLKVIAELQAEIAGMKKRKRKPKTSVEEPAKKVKGTPVDNLFFQTQALVVHNARID